MGKFECGDVVFEDSIKFYECGVELKVWCEVKLKEVEEKVVVIILDGNGEFFGLKFVEGL